MSCRRLRTGTAASLRRRVAQERKDAVRDARTHHHQYATRAPSGIGRGGAAGDRLPRPARIGAQGSRVGSPGVVPSSCFHLDQSSVWIENRADMHRASTRHLRTPQAPRPAGSLGHASPLPATAQVLPRARRRETASTCPAMRTNLGFAVAARAFPCTLPPCGSKRVPTRRRSIVRPRTLFPNDPAASRFAWAGHWSMWAPGVSLARVP